jgi:hypothetical protein
VYTETDPRDQSEFLQQLQNLLKGKPVAAALSLLTRYVCLAASSGRPEAMEAFIPSIRGDPTAGSLPDLAGQFVAAKNKFWRGGQPHGALKKNNLPDAISAFLANNAASMEVAIDQWRIAGSLEETKVAVRQVLAEVRSCAKPFHGGDYYCKRCLEILLLGGFAVGWPMNPHDLDALADWWPLGNGTKSGARRIFPAARNDVQMREVLRVLQRACGGGKRKIPLVRISAFLCFWHRCLEGSMHWPVWKYCQDLCEKESL